MKIWFLEDNRENYCGHRILRDMRGVNIYEAEELAKNLEFLQ